MEENSEVFWGVRQKVQLPKMERFDKEVPGATRGSKTADNGRAEDGWGYTKDALPWLAVWGPGAGESESWQDCGLSDPDWQQKML